MNRVIPLGVLALAILAFATLMLVILPGIQIREQAPTPGLLPYTEAELRGRAVYVSEGCVYCHSQQPRALDQQQHFNRIDWSNRPGNTPRNSRSQYLARVGKRKRCCKREAHVLALA
jgi:cytochrome c oxidase cbb3-type subunit 2